MKNSAHLRPFHGFRRGKLWLLWLAIQLLLAFRTLALNPALPPGGNFDLSHWYLQLPTSNGILTGASGSVDPLSTAQLLAGATNAYFYTGPDGAMTFWVPDSGAHTGGSLSDFRLVGCLATMLFLVWQADGRIINTVFFSGTMATNAVKPWTGGGCNYPWTIVLSSGNPFEQNANANYAGWAMQLNPGTGVFTTHLSGQTTNVFGSALYACTLQPSELVSSLILRLLLNESATARFYCIDAQR